MPLPQVNDRLKEIPAQALRTVFATIGQLLLVADRIRARAAEQLSGGGEATATRPADQAPAPTPAPPPPAPAKPARPDAESSRWRSLDKTGNVRVLDGGEEQDDEDMPGVTQAVPEPAPAPAPSAEYTPTEVVPVVSVPDEPAPAEPAQAKPAMQQEAEPAAAKPAMQQEAEPAPAKPAPAETAPAKPAMQQEAEPAPPATSAGEALPVPNYDQLSVASLRARLRVLDAGQVQTLLDYENAHERRPAVISLFERRLIKLGEGN
jgi:outer membrane biosynthesis protein TonB